MKTFFTSLICLFLSAASFAFKPTDVDYSADWVMETKDGKFAFKVYNTKLRERRDMNEKGQSMVMIMHKDTHTTYMLMPDEGMYMEIKAGGMMQDGSKQAPELNDYSYEYTEEGKETVNGVKCTKFKMVMSNKKKPKEKFGGFMWMSKDDIMVKLDAIAIEGKSKERIKMDLFNLQVGKQEPSVFEIPKDLEKFSMPGF